MGQCEVEFGTELFTECTTPLDKEEEYSYLVKLTGDTDATGMYM